MTVISLVDEGGFIGLPRQPPFPDQDYTSQNVDISLRAQRGAWTNNALFMGYFGLSYPGNKRPRNSSRSCQFSLSTTYKTSQCGVALSRIDGHFQSSSLQIRQYICLEPHHRGTKQNEHHVFQFYLRRNALFWYRVWRWRKYFQHCYCLRLHAWSAPTNGRKGLTGFRNWCYYTQSFHLCASGVRASIKKSSRSTVMPHWIIFVYQQCRKYRR